MITTTKARLGTAISPARTAVSAMIPRTGCCKLDFTARDIGKWMNAEPRSKPFLPIKLESLDKSAILLPAFDCSPAPVSIFRKAPSAPCQSAELSSHFDSSMQRQTLEEYFRRQSEFQHHRR